MTHVRLDRLYDGYLFSCEGHAGFADAGRDIVCAGVSALCIALVERLKTLCCEGVARVPRLDVRDGALHAEFNVQGDKREDLILCSTVETVMEGLRAVAALYPDYVTVEE